MLNCKVEKDETPNWEIEKQLLVKIFSHYFLPPFSHHDPMIQS